MRRILAHFPTETLILHKLTGEIYIIDALLGKDGIMSEDTTVPIEDEDYFERKLPNGIIEYYEVIDSGYHKGTPGIPDHYQTKVKKIKYPPMSNNEDENNNIENYNDTFIMKKNDEKSYEKNYVTEELLYRVLNYYRDHPNAKASELGIDTVLYYNVMEIMHDQGLVKGINIKYGNNGTVYAVLVHDVRLTLAGIRFLDDRKEEPKVYVEEEGEDSEITIFLSYSWSDSELADKIEKDLKDEGFIVCRDIRDIGAWKSIKEFMKSIRKRDYVVSLISDKYLYSENCMYEIGELLKDENYKSRLFPVIISEDIYDIDKRIAYVKYWEERNIKLGLQIETLSLSNRASFTDALRKSKEIEASIGDFLSEVADMNNPKILNVSDAIIGEIKRREEMLKV